MKVTCAFMMYPILLYSTDEGSHARATYMDLLKKKKLELRTAAGHTCAVRPAAALKFEYVSFCVSLEK